MPSLIVSGSEDSGYGMDMVVLVVMSYNCYDCSGVCSYCNNYGGGMVFVVDSYDCYCVCYDKGCGCHKDACGSDCTDPRCRSEFAMIIIMVMLSI